MHLLGELLRVTSQVGSRAVVSKVARDGMAKIWGRRPEPSQDRKETLKEMKAATRKWHDNSRAFHAASVHEEKEDNPIFCHLLQSYSTFTKIRRVLVYVHRFVDIIRRRAVPNRSWTVQDLQRSELQLFKWSQLHLDVSQLDEKLIATMNEEGLIRAHSRLENARILPKDMRNPVVLPRDHPLAILLLRHLHRKRGHWGYKSLMHEARRTLWIIGLRKMANSVVSKCVDCRKLRKKSLQHLMSQLPSLRVAAGFPPISNTAMDMFGPLQVRLNRRTLQDAQVVNFTCATTRVVHLELVTDKLAEPFLTAFRRFACLRGHPLCRGTGISERGNAKLGNPQDTKHPFGGICLWFWMAVNRTSHMQVTKTGLSSRWSSVSGKPSTVYGRIKRLLKSNGELFWLKLPT